MGILISFFTSLYGKVAALVVKLFTAGASLLTRTLARLGIKLLSYGWISKLFEGTKKALSIIKKIILNEKVTTVLKYVLAIGLCALSLVQICLIGVAVYKDMDQIIMPVKALDVSTIIFLVIAGISLITTLLYSLASIVKIFKRKINLNFAPALFFTYLILRFFSLSINNASASMLLKSFYLVDAFAIVLLVYAFIKIFNKTYPVSFLGVFFAIVSIIVGFIVFKAAKFGSIINFELIGEALFTGKDVDMISAIKALINPDQAKGIMYVITRNILIFSNDSGVFVSSIVLTISVVAIIISHLLPYLLISCVIGLAMGLINERQPQYKYLSKSIKALGFLVITLVISFVLTLVVSLIKRPQGSYFIISQNLGALLFSLGMTVLVIITTAIARALFARKIY